MKIETNRIIAAISLALTLSLGFAASQASATKLNAQPLPHERQSKDFSNSDSETVISKPSQFQRRPDFREIETEKKKEEQEALDKAAQAKKDAEDAHKKAELEALDDLKKRQAMAIEANNKAVALGKSGHLLEAMDAHMEAIQLDPNNKQFRVNLSAARVAYGKIKLKAGDLNTAASMFRKALSAAADNGMAATLLSQVMEKQGRDPNSADIRLATGDQLSAAGDYEGATIEYQAAMQLEPSGRSYTKMGDMALRYGQIGTATNWYRQAIVKDPDYGAAHRQLGLLALTQRDFTGAAASLRKAIILDPHDTAAGEALVEIWRRQVAANPNLAENHLGLAGALQLSSDFVGAESEYQRLEALDPNNPGLKAGRASLMRAVQHGKAEKHKEAAETLYNQGLRREALSEISQAVMLEPRNGQYQFLLGECLEANGDYQGAHQAYLTCVLIDPENNKEAAVRLKKMELRRATPMAPRPTQMAMPQASQPSPFNAGGAYDLGTPRKDMFEQAPTNAANTQDNDAGLSDALGKVTDAEANRDYTTAISILRQALTVNLQNAEAHHRLAIDLLASGNITDAVAEFRIASALSPGKKIYTDDLARALSILKRAEANPDAKIQGQE